MWINLLTDSGPALALGVDPPPKRRHAPPPRRLNDHVTDGEMWLTIVVTGVVMAVVSLLALDLCLAGGFVGGSGGIDEARTTAFTTLVLAQFFLLQTPAPSERARSTACSRTAGSGPRLRCRWCSKWPSCSSSS